MFDQSTNMKTPITLFALIASAFAGMAADLAIPLAPPDLVFEEADGVAAIAAFAAGAEETAAAKPTATQKPIVERRKPDGTAAATVAAS